MFVSKGSSVLFSAAVAIFLGIVIFRRVQLNAESVAEPSLPTLSSPDSSSKYLALVGNKQQLGNQIWSLISGWSIAQKLRRKFYVSQNWHDSELLNFKLMDVHKIFPKLSKAYEILAPKDEIVVAHNYYQGRMNITHYEDPLVHEDRPERFLVLDSPYAQNALYFHENTEEVRDFLSFSNRIQQQGEEFIREKGFIGNQKVVCAHIRRRDFTTYNWQSELGSSADLIRFVVQRENHTRLLIFGDDQDFMEELVSSLQDDGVVSQNSIVSSNSKGIDLFLSSRICSSVAITSQSSSFAFWLAFLSQHQESVYYLNDKYDPTNPYKPRFDENFPLSWNDVKFEEGFGRIVNQRV